MNTTIQFPESCERWGIYEIAVPGKTDRNPFRNKISASFIGEKEQVSVSGFYDGNGIYKVRFMPSYEGKYAFSLAGDFSEEVYAGTFLVTPPAENNHGPVRVANTYHFKYADGTPYYSIGTTCYVWNLQDMELQAETLETLKNSAFNKIRFCIMPKHYDYNLSDPISFPYEGTPCDCSEITHKNFMEYGASFPGHHVDVAADNDWDFSRFNPAHFQLLEKNIEALGKLGIEADLILFHPYDRWGFSTMSHAQDDFYLRYVVARLSAYHNVWWSMANEYDLLPQKTTLDWDYLGTLVMNQDPYNHLRSIHNCRVMYDFSKEWITHCSIQRIDLYVSAENTDEWRKQFHKPIVLDEICYEGNIQHGWGNISGEEMTRRFWEATCRGGYAGHGETILEHVPTDDPADHDIKLWWSHGGKLKGESPERFKFLLDVMNDIPNGWGLKPYAGFWDEVAAVPDDPSQDAKKIKDYYLFYFSFMRPLFRIFHMDDETSFEIDVLDTWNMKVQHLGIKKGEFTVPLNGNPYMAIRLKKVEI